MKTSKLLGILSICSSFLIPFLGFILAIIGLHLSKKNKENTKEINVFALVLSIVLWIIYMIISVVFGEYY